MSLRRFDPKLIDDITAVASHLEGERLFLREVLCTLQRSARKGRVSGSGEAKHFALKEIESVCAEALARTDRDIARKQGGAK